MSSQNVQKPPTTSTHFLSPRQVAQAVGVSESSLKRWCDRGDIRVTKTAGGHRRIDRRVVVRYLRERGFEAKKPDLMELAKESPQWQLAVERYEAMVDKFTENYQELERSVADQIRVSRENLKQWRAEARITLNQLSELGRLKYA